MKWHILHLQNDSFVDGELGDDVRQKQMAVVLGGRVDTHLGQQARPRKRHQPTKLIALLPAMTASQLLSPLSSWISLLHSTGMPSESRT